MRIMPVPSAFRYRDQSSISIPSQMREWTLGSSYLPVKLIIEMLANNSCNSYNLRILVDSPSPRGFLIKSFHIKIMCLSFFCCALSYLTHTPLFNFACGMDRPSNNSWRKASTTPSLSYRKLWQILFPLFSSWFLAFHLGIGFDEKSNPSKHLGKYFVWALFFTSKPNKAFGDRIGMYPIFYLHPNLTIEKFELEMRW